MSDVRAAARTAGEERGLVLDLVRGVILGRPEGQAAAYAELKRLGGRPLVNRCLETLVQSGQIIRVHRAYYAPPLPASPSDRRRVIHALVRNAVAAPDEVLAPDGPTSGYMLGFLRQPPVRIVFLTTGAERVVQVGRFPVEFRHAEPWWFLLPDTDAGTAIRALGWVGPERAPEVLEAIRRRLGADVLRRLRDHVRDVPDWISALLESEPRRADGPSQRVDAAPAP